MAAVSFVSFFIAIIVPAYPLLKEKKDALKEHDAEREDPEYERKNWKSIYLGLIMFNF